MLLNNARMQSQTLQRGRRGEVNEEKKLQKACSLVEQGELFRARQVLTGCALAPGTPATLAALKNEERRPPEPLKSLPQEVLDFEPAERVSLNNQNTFERRGKH